MTSTSASTSTKRPVVIFPRTTPTEQPVKHRVLLVDDDDAVRDVMGATLERKGFDVVAAANVAEALRLITTQSFDVLITDLHMPNPSDGFAVVTAMRHSQPDALTLLVIVSGYPDVLRSMAAVLLEADEVIVKPFEAGKLAELLRDKMLTRKPAARMEQERVGAILQRCLASIIKDWLARVEKSTENLPLSDDDRTGHLPELIEDLVGRLGRSSATAKDSDASSSGAAMAHGGLRYSRGYTPAMLVHESRMLQVTLFGALQSNLSSLDFSLLLPDVITIADEVDAQLTQTMDSYMNAARKAGAA
jgi:CheY-like chemotaxis protein